MCTVLFFRTRAPIEPVSFVRHICRDALNHPERKRTRYAKRFSPVTLMGRASEEGLEAVAKEVLAPHFHGEGSASKKVSFFVFLFSSSPLFLCGLTG